jgi:magnesium transporter
MVTEYLSYDENLLVSDVLDDLRRHGARYSDYDVQYAYLTSGDRRLVGVLRLRDFLLSQPDRPIRSLMIADPLHVRVDAPLESLMTFFREHHFLGVPVVDGVGRLVGVLRRLAVEAAEGDLANAQFLKVSGHVGDEELRSMPLRRRSLRRLSWLSVNIGLNVVAASVIAVYQETLQAAIVLAVFLPIISDMSGCSGNQAVAVSIRELTLGLVRPYEFLRVLGKEASVGLLNGLALGLILGSVAFLWKGNVYLGLVVGGAMMLNTLVAVSLGGMIPLALKAARADPALASGPILTTVTDMCGFFFVLSFATVMLSRLTP